VAVGWWPAYDVNPAQSPNNPAGARCLAVARRAGVPVNSLFERSETETLCEGVWLLQAGWRGAPRLTAASLRAGVDALGTSFDSPSTMASRFGPGISDGVAALRRLAFDDACDCFRYTSSPVPV
jgi:hypothetical protein